MDKQRDYRKTNDRYRHFFVRIYNYGHLIKEFLYNTLIENENINAFCIASPLNASHVMLFLDFKNSKTGTDVKGFVVNLFQEPICCYVVQINPNLCLHYMTKEDYSPLCKNIQEESFSLAYRIYHWAHRTHILSCCDPFVLEHAMLYTFLRDFWFEVHNHH
jgi:hypothetical protein